MIFIFIFYVPSKIFFNTLRETWKVFLNFRVENKTENKKIAWEKKSVTQNQIIISKKKKKNDSEKYL